MSWENGWLIPLAFAMGMMFESWLARRRWKKAKRDEALMSQAILRAGEKTRKAVPK